MPITSTTLSCDTVVANFTTGIFNCLAPFYYQRPNNVGAADSVARILCSCVCADPFRSKNMALQYLESNKCDLPLYLTKDVISTVSNACLDLPTHQFDIIQAFNLTAYLSNGKKYVPLSKMANSKGFALQNIEISFLLFWIFF